MDYGAYHRALNMGFSERDATRMGEDAWEDARHNESRMRHQRPNPSGPLCDICGDYEAVASANGYHVCSQACDNAANYREPKKPESEYRVICEPRIGGVCARIVRNGELLGEAWGKNKAEAEVEASKFIKQFSMPSHE